jgi:hypothetical protein
MSVNDKKQTLDFLSHMTDLRAKLIEARCRVADCLKCREIGANLGRGL